MSFDPPVLTFASASHVEARLLVAVNYIRARVVTLNQIRVSPGQDIGYRLTEVCTDAEQWKTDTVSAPISYTPNAMLHQQHRIDASVQLWRIRHLRVLAPHNLAALRYQAKVAHVDLDHRALRHDSQLQQQAGEFRARVGRSEGMAQIISVSEGSGEGLVPRNHRGCTRRISRSPVKAQTMNCFSISMYQVPL